MKNFKQPLLTIFVIFATAYILSMMGCSGSSGGSGGAAQPAADVTPNGQTNQTVLQPINTNDMRECTSEEFSTLVSWSNSLAASDDAIKTSGGRKSDQVVKLAQEAMQKCDQVEFYHTQKPCKKTKRVITTPDKPSITGYDAYRIDQRCKSTENYLLKFNLRPDPKQVIQPQPEPVDPVTPAPIEPQPVDPPVVVSPTPVDPAQLRQCSADEFSKLNTWRASLDLANKNIAKLGNQSSWKYDQNAIDAAKTATVSCEALSKYHEAQPCKREKSYTAQTLKEQCQTSRQYYYNFAQRTDSLITPNAKLYLDTRVIANRTYEPGPANLSVGLCVLTNQSNSVITYSGQKTLVTEARVYPDQEHKMFVIVTAEGLKFECYGVDYQSAATSLNEVMRLLSARDTNLPLSYELN